jgi:hypothetical protein
VFAVRGPVRSSASWRASNALNQALLLACCAACVDSAPSGSGIEGVSHVEVHELPAFGPPKLDVVFVVDDTIAMEPYQERLAGLPAVFEQTFLVTLAGQVDMHVAVATSTGGLRRIPSVGSAYMSIRTEYDLARITNFTESFRTTFEKLSVVAASSTGANQPLDAARRVVEANPDGLLRPSVPLAIVLVTASDDASSEAVSTYADIFESSKGDPGNVMVIALAAGSTPRLDELFAALPNRYRVSSLADDYQPALDHLGQMIKTILPGLCWNASDVDPATPGAQYDCTFTATIRGAQRVLPPCELPGDQFCWSLVPSDHGCAEHAPLKPELPPYRFWTFLPAMRAECVVLE